MDDRDIWRSAKALIDQHGADTAIHAAMRADKLLDAGDLDGAATWRRVILVYTRYSVLNFPDEKLPHPSCPAPNPVGGNSCFFC